jgi:TolB-like protein
MPISMLRPMRLVSSIAVLLGSSATLAVAQTKDTRPTVAVLYFTNGSLQRNADYAALSKGIATILITDLASNTKVRVVEREQLQSVLEEQNLASAGRVDNETAAKIGKILGAKYMLTGGFVVDLADQMRLDVRAVDVETSLVLSQQAWSVRGKTADLLDLISQMSGKVNDGLKLPALQSTSGSSQSKPASTSKPSREGLRLAMLLGKAAEEQDKKNVNGAIVLVNQALEIEPNDPSAKKMLAALQRQKGD